MPEQDLGYRVERDGGVWTFVIDREESRNSLTMEVRHGLLQTIVDAENDPECGVLILTGAGEKAFCAGGDVQDQRVMLEGISVASSTSLMRLVGDIVRRILTTPIVIISAVNGAAFGGGCFMALSADIVVASKSAKFGFGFTKRGLVPDWGGFFILPRLIGLGRAKSLILRGATLEAQEAYDMGMIAELVDENALAHARRIADELSSGPRLTLGISKQVLARAFETGLEGTLTYEMLAQTLALSTDDHKEGVTSFLEKRQAVFRGT